MRLRRSHHISCYNTGALMYINFGRLGSLAAKTVAELIKVIIALMNALMDAVAFTVTSAVVIELKSHPVF